MTKNTLSPMVVKAKEIAKAHGFNINHEVKSPADGHCAIHAVIENVNRRSCFGETHIYDSIKMIREKVFTDLKDSVFEFTGGYGYSDDEFDIAWDNLKYSNLYENSLYDFILPMMAKWIKKDIFVIYTSDRNSDQIGVVTASKLGGNEADSRIPVILAYDGSHFEGLVPSTPGDIQKSIALKEDYLSGTYSTSESCNKGFKGCPGKVPYTAHQCRSHRVQAYVKSKMEEERGQGPENAWIKAVMISHHKVKSHCKKECCSSIPSSPQQVVYSLKKWILN